MKSEMFVHPEAVSASRAYRVGIVLGDGFFDFFAVALEGEHGRVYAGLI